MVHFGVTRTPTEAWVTQQLREATPFGQGPQYLTRDNDNKFGTRFDEVAKATGIEVLRIPHRAPRANAICERFLQSVRCEGLDHLSPGRPMSRWFSASGSCIGSCKNMRRITIRLIPIKASSRRYRKDREKERIRGGQGRLFPSPSSAGCTTIIVERPEAESSHE